MNEPGTAQWRRAQASRLIAFGRAAALIDGGFGWLGVDGEIDVTQPRPLYVDARMTHVFALAHLDGVVGADSLADIMIDPSELSLTTIRRMRRHKIDIRQLKCLL